MHSDVMEFSHFHTPTHSFSSLKKGTENIESESLSRHRKKEIFSLVIKYFPPLTMHEVLCVLWCAGGLQSDPF